MMLTALTYVAMYLTVGMVLSIGVCRYIGDNDDFGWDEAHTVLFLWPLVVAASIYYYVTDKGDDE
jgi:TRAP-type C4-dicarboxylate transport system permease small subunit